MKSRRVALPATALGCVLAVTGCSTERPAGWRGTWERVNLPGFSVMLPPGEVMTNNPSPSQGKHQRELSGSFVAHFLQDVVTNGSVSASWSTQATTREEWTSDYLPMHLEGLKMAIPEPKVLKEELVGADRWLAIIGNERVPLAIGTVRCDDSFAIEFSYAHYHDPVRQAEDMRHLLRTVRCNVSDENRAPVRAATRLPEKFGLVSAGDPQLYRSLDDETVALNFTTGHIQKDPKLYLTVIKAMLAQSLDTEIPDSQITLVVVPRALHLEPTSLHRVIIPDTREGMYVGSVYCEQGDMTLISVWSGPDPTDNVAIQRLSQVGCPETPSTPTLSFESIVESACQAGDTAACAIKSGSAGS